MFDEIKNCWTIPDGWKVQIGDEYMEVTDTDDESVAAIMTQINVIRKIIEHTQAQEHWTALQLMQAAMKKPIEA